MCIKKIGLLLAMSRFLLSFAYAKSVVTVYNNCSAAKGGVVITIDQNVDWSKACFGYIKTKSIGYKQKKKWRVPNYCTYAITGAGLIVETKMRRNNRRVFTFQKVKSVNSCVLARTVSGGV